MDNFDKSQSRISARMLAMMMLSQGSGGQSIDSIMPKLPEPKPRGYRVHLSKAQRRGKTFEELQKMREEMIEG